MKGRSRSSTKRVRGTASKARTNCTKRCWPRYNVRMLPLATALIGGALLVQAQPYTPPAASTALLKGIPFASAQPAGDRFKSRFSECDTKDTCDGKAQKRGCSKDRNSNTALLKLPGGAIFFDGKMGVDADGSPLSRNN